jgi:hypothetical protein
MSTKDIRTSHSYTVCDVCGRTLLRGEHSEVYINGGARRSVCELCKTRALHEGWVREGTLPDYDNGEAGSERRRSILGRLRHRRDGDDLAGPPSLDDQLSGQTSDQDTAPRRSASRRRAAAEKAAAAVPDPGREHRHVRAVPSSDDQKVVTAVELFNGSEHRRTIAGVARSLGAPVVSIAPGDERPSLISIVVSWELCWYRYEVDLSDDQPSVRVHGQGYELDELTDRERLPNATADDVGQLTAA